MKEIKKIMHRILIVDDEDAIRKGLKEYAQFMGYEVEEACDGMEAVKICRQQDFDAIVMDIMMPKLDGFGACKEIQKLKDIPVLMLSARGEEYDKLYGFELGIDDYVVKPFSAREVMARLNVIITRNEHQIQEASDNGREIYRFDGLEVDFDGRNVKIDGNKAEMTPKEYELLFYLVKNRGIALSREKLLTDVWGFDFYGDDRTVDTHIKMLRMSIGRYRDFIVTMRGVGYKFEV